MHDLCMAIKTISLELDAYEKLRRAKRNPRESFSSVVRRGRWDGIAPKAGELLDDLRALAVQDPDTLLGKDVLDAMEKRKRTVRAKPKWRS